MNQTAETIKQALTMQEVAEYYGFHPNRSGYIRCPFHNERTGSMKLYSGSGGFHCFGCGAHGGVIDFVMHLFDDSFSGSVERLNSDFSLGLRVGNATSYRDKKDAKIAYMERRRMQKDLSDADSECERLDFLYAAADAIIREETASDLSSISDGYVWAIQNIDRIKYDLLLAEDRRWELEQTPGSSNMGKRSLSDRRTI